MTHDPLQKPARCNSSAGLPESTFNAVSARYVVPSLCELAVLPTILRTVFYLVVLLHNVLALSLLAFYYH